ncbi:TetR/AcrR family transcriptional regulator [Halpernia sp.]|uniref:TetR/AcrR family transcriptional regulator n=1 Tax=Halpernia sp. TaxID=2782209 RepID=UPI003A911EC7
MNEKTIFLEKVSELFFENGAKAVTMDDVAKHVSISKRTLYEEYKNKEELLTAILDFKLQKIIDTIKTNDAENTNAIEKVLIKDNDFEKFSSTNQSVFIRQLLKYYPSIFDQHILNMNEKISEFLVKNIEKGREEGLYRADFNESLYIRFLLKIMLSFENSVLFENEQCERSNFCFEGVLFYLYSISTEKGREILEKAKLKQ